MIFTLKPDLIKIKLFYNKNKLFKHLRIVILNVHVFI
jgi:hypothetical protein